MDFTGLTIDLTEPIQDAIEENLKHGKFPDYDDYIFWNNKTKRIFSIVGEIYSGGLLSIIDEINQLNIQDANVPRKDLKPITILISSEGGAFLMKLLHFVTQLPQVGYLLSLFVKILLTLPLF